MTIPEAIKARHSVRQYTDRPIPDDIRMLLDECAASCSKEGNLHIFIQYDDPDGFDSGLARYGKFTNVRNYIVLAGKKEDRFQERCGYYGEILVLYAQTLGLNTCWTALTFNKRKVASLLPKDEHLCMVIALGYGKTQGVPHKGRTYEEVARGENVPDWFRKGVEAALLAPTATNQQKFRLTYRDGVAWLRSAGIGIEMKTDLGIVKYHFDAVSGHEAKME